MLHPVPSALALALAALMAAGPALAETATRARHGAAIHQRRYRSQQ